MPYLGGQLQFHFVLRHGSPNRHCPPAIIAVVAPLTVSHPTHTSWQAQYIVRSTPLTNDTWRLLSLRLATTHFTRAVGYATSITDSPPCQNWIKSGTAQKPNKELSRQPGLLRCLMCPASRPLSDSITNRLKSTASKHLGRTQST